MEEYIKLRKMLIIGIIASFITTIFGDMPIGWVVYPETGNKYMDIIIGSKDVSILQMACGLFFGAIFIPLQYYGVKAISEIIEKNKCKYCSKIIDVGAKAFAFIGGTVHVLCVVAMYIYKMEATSNLLQIPKTAIVFLIWLLLPISILFMSIYVLMCFAIAIPILKGKTVFSKWMAIFNPLLGKIVLNLLALVIPNTKIFNAIRMGNMGIGSMITFVAFYVLLPKELFN